MNQHQRKFLLEAVEKQYKNERDKLTARKPEEPTLNNYMIAAILDGSFVMKTPTHIRENFLDRVRSLGKSEALVEREDRWGRKDRSERPMMTVPVDVLFEMPAPYAKDMAEYQEHLARWEEEMELLESSIGAMRIKVQIGSDKSLEALVEQADKLCSMSLTTSNQLLLGGAK